MSDEDSYWENYNSGPFCHHWGTPGYCDECREEQRAPWRALAYRAIGALQEFDQKGFDELMAAAKELENG